MRLSPNERGKQFGVGWAAIATQQKQQTVQPDIHTDSAFLLGLANAQITALCCLPASHKV